MAYKKPKRSTFQNVVMVVVVIMLILIIFGAIAAIAPAL
jgi:preprotein translocase subunit SecE